MQEVTDLIYAVGHVTSIIGTGAVVVMLVVIAIDTVKSWKE